MAAECTRLFADHEPVPGPLSRLAVDDVARGDFQYGGEQIRLELHLKGSQYTASLIFRWISEENCSTISNISFDRA